MRKFLFLFQEVISISVSAQNKSGSLNNLWPDDWLVKTTNRQSQVIYSTDKKEITLYNGLVKRTFRVLPNVVCIDYKNMITGQQLLRAISPEARLIINGKEYNVGGLHGQKEKAYLLPEWVESFRNNEYDVQFINYANNKLIFSNR